MVAGPIAGRSKRRSWPGLAALATTRPRPHSAAARRSAASVPSTASIAATTPSRTADRLADVEAAERAHHAKGELQILELRGGRLGAR